MFSLFNLHKNKFYKNLHMVYKLLGLLFLVNLSLFSSRIITVSQNGLSLVDAMYQTQPGDIIEIKGGKIMPLKI